VRVRSRVMTVGAVTGFAVLGLAGPALAHVEVSADAKTAGAANVTLTFSGEAEKDGAGIKSERVVLPEGIAPDTVTLVKAPSEWTFATTADGFTVGGKALAEGVDAVWQVKIAKLPDGVTRLSFKTLETYSNGDVDRWIEIQEAGKEEPDHPAPLVTLKPGPSTAPATATIPSPVPSATPPVVVASPTPVAAEPAADTSSTWWIWLLVAAVVIAGGVAVLMRRRRS
jgi:uncharacterized protein YcnI